MADTSLFKRLWNGLFVPRPGTGIIDGLEQSLSLAGIIIPVSDLAAAALILDGAENQGVVISSENPAHFSVGSAEPVKYTCTGKDTETGKWRIAPFNEPEFYEGKWLLDSVNQQDITLNNSTKDLMSMFMPARPYKRRIRADAAVWGWRKNGWVTARLYLPGRITGSDFSTSDGGGTSISGSVELPAGTAATITVRAFGTGTVRVSGARAETWLTGTADPIRMEL